MISEIEERGGRVSFADFMELALYHPENGYYSDPDPRYGREGDFMTAPTASSWYGRVMAHFLKELASLTGGVTLVDLAAGDGSFLVTVGEALGENRRKVLGRVVGVERSPAMRCHAAARLDNLCHLVAQLDHAEPAVGPVVLHASELFDAFPVDRVIAGEGGLKELWVAVEDGMLVWERHPAPSALVSYFMGHGVRLAAGQVAEINRSAAAIHRAILEWAGSEALVLVLDYGYEARRLYDPRGRAQGSLACYHRHELSRDPLINPGRLDITAHVNWDDLRLPATDLDWQELGVWPLAEWLVRAGLPEVAEAHGLGMEADLDAKTFAARQEIKRLLDPEGMGSDLKMLIQGKGRVGERARAVLTKKAVPEGTAR